MGFYPDNKVKEHIFTTKDKYRLCIPVFSRPVKGENIMKKKIILLVVIVFILVPILSSCIDMVPVTVRGGGWLPYYGEYGMALENSEPIGEGKATFGFTVTCYNAEYDESSEVWMFDVKGQFLYIDHFKGIRVKGPVIGATYWDGCGVFGGECIYDGMPATFNVGVYDSGKPGTGDMFSIEIYIDSNLEYKNAGPLGGGNIKMHYPKSEPTPLS